MGFGNVNKQNKSHTNTALPKPSQAADCDGSLVTNGWAVYTAWILKNKGMLDVLGDRLGLGGGVSM